MFFHQTSLRPALLLTTAVSAALFAGSAFAQGAQGGSQANQLEEVVVTATRQADTVNRVPLAVTAETQKSLDEQGVRTVRDLATLVPSLQTTQSLASGASQFSIRGIGFLGANPAGAAPVGFYLDETSLQKRNVGGGVATSNGTPLPPIFDLDRVEVLRGPQGTLFGGGSEGGTIRYIQPAPSLTRYSEYARAQYSTPKKGDDSYEAGVAVGGPIIQDKLGFRASVFARKIGGFIDRIDPLTGKIWAKNSGGEDRMRMMRLALAWAPTDRSKITIDWFGSRDESHDLSETYNLPLTGKITQPTLCFNANATPLGLAGFDRKTGLGINTSPTAPVASLPTDPVARTRSSMNPVGRGDAACNQLAAQGKVTYTMPGYSVGPFNLDRYQTFSSIDTAPSKTNLEVASLTFDYDFGSMSMKAISSYIFDQTKTVTEQTGPIQTGSTGAYSYNDPVLGGVIIAPRGTMAWNPIYGPTSAGVAGHFVSNNKRYGFTQEIRFTSNGGDTNRLSWTAGVFYSNIRGKAGYDNYQPLDFWAERLFGVTEIQRFGIRGNASAPGLYNNYDRKRQRLKDVEVAGYAEANYWIVPEKLKATAGIRVSRLSFDYDQTFEGPVTSVGFDNPVPAYQVPSPANGGANSGSSSESPVTPKVGLQYQITNNDMVYLTAAKGFRAGGVNSEVSYGICQQGLDPIGLKPTDMPLEYKSDSVWSYEAGAKLRMLENRVQLNGDVYRIDWKNAQFTTPMPFCGLVTTFNVPSARSQGFELEAQALVVRGLTMNGSLGYTDAKYTSDLFVAAKPSPTTTLPGYTLVGNGQPMPLPKWTYSIGARYEAELNATMQWYVRGDYRGSSGYFVNPMPSSNYTPDQMAQAYHTANIRVGLDYGDFDFNVFVNNALDRKTGMTGGGRSACNDQPACNSFRGYTPWRTLNTGYPREIGIQIAYRH
jgi:outer membrane receptor protein involved in Fe transport